MKQSLLGDNTRYYEQLADLLEHTSSDEQLFKMIVNAPFHDRAKPALLGLGITVLLLVNKKNATVDRIALSDTELAKGTVQMSVKPFKDIRIPLDYEKNYIVKAIREGHWQKTGDWQYMFNPVLTPEEARFNQAGGGIGCSVIYPLAVRDGGAMIFSYFLEPDKIDHQHHKFMKTYVDMVDARLKA